MFLFYRRKSMKKLCFSVILVALLPVVSNAADKKMTYQEEMYLLGAVSGQGLACKSKKYHQFELLARALIVGKAPNGTVQKEGINSYNTGKAEAFMEMEESGFANCAETKEAFEKQPIFQSVLYSDGRIKMYDGTIIKPRKAYDASKLYQKDREAFIKADRAYKKYVAEANKNAQNVKKVPLHDANYSQFAKEFSNQ